MQKRSFDFLENVYICNIENLENVQKRSFENLENV